MTNLEFKLELVQYKIDELDKVIIPLQYGVENYSISEFKQDNRAEELQEFLSIKNALIQEKNRLIGG